MKQLSDGLQYDNQNFDESFGNYLIANGFKTNYIGNVLFFRTKKIKIQVTGNSIDIYKCYPELSTKCECEKWIYDQSFFNYANMNLFKFILLMHAMSIVCLKEFSKRRASDDRQIALEAQQIIKFIILTEIQELEPAEYL